MPCNYIMAPNGEIWFTDNIKFTNLNFSSSQYLNLPVPFKKGDIITIDCRPFVPVKHADFFDNGLIEVSPLYRAELFTGELPDKEKPLKEIADKLCT